MADLYLYEDVEPGSAAKFVAELAKVKDEDITLHVSSYGGDVFEGMVMLNALRSHPSTVTAVVEGVAASIASVIVVGGADRVVMRPGSRMMVHNALTVAMGDANELAMTGERLRETSADLAKIYAERAGTPVDEWQLAMDKTTWFSDAQAVAAGLADAVEDGRPAKVEPVLASAGSRMMNKFQDRRGDPPAVLLKSHPEGGERSGTMSLTKEDIVAIIRSEFQNFRNEAVTISGEVEVTYPSDVKIVPTERIKVEPVIGDKPAETTEGDELFPIENVDEPAGDSPAVSLAKSAGMTFAMGEVPEGFTAEVDEGGVVTITAPSGAEVGSTASFTVTVNDTPVTLAVTVRSLSDDSDDETGVEEAAPVELPPVLGDQMQNKKILDLDTYSELKAAAQFGWSAMEAKKETDLEVEVDTWIKDGRISASLRSKAVAAIKRDPMTARDLYGANPKNTIPRGEVGYGRESAEGFDPGAAALRQKPNPFPKPKF